MESTIAQVKKQPLLSGVLILFLVAMIFANLGGNMYGPLMPLYLRDLRRVFHRSVYSLRFRRLFLYCYKFWAVG